MCWHGSARSLDDIFSASRILYSQDRFQIRIQTSLIPSHLCPLPYWIASYSKLIVHWRSITISRLFRGHEVKEYWHSCSWTPCRVFSCYFHQLTAEFLLWLAFLYWSDSLGQEAISPCALLIISSTPLFSLLQAVYWVWMSIHHH